MCSSRDRSFSAINGDGIPVQVSVALGASTSALRVLGEVGTPGMSMPARINATTIRLREIVSILGLTNSAPQINHALARLLPAQATETMRWTGGIWLGIAASPKGAVRLRVYVNQRWGSVGDRYLRIDDFLNELQWSTRADWGRIAPLLAASAIPYGAAIDVEPGRLGCLKVYFACERSTPDYWDEVLTQLALRNGADVIAAIESLCGSQLERLQPNALLPSIELTPHKGSRPSLKLDVSCNHVGSSDVEQERRAIAFAAAQAIDTAEYENVRDLVAPAGLDPRNVARIQYWGVGLAPTAEPRLNVYFSPDLSDRADEARRRRTMHAQQSR